MSNEVRRRLSSSGTSVLGVFIGPRNDRLAEVPADSEPARAYWPVYVREWSFWNHVRTVAALASAACGILALTTW